MPSLPAGRVTNDPANYIAVGLQSGKDVDATTFYFLKHLDGSGFDVAVDAASERVGGSGREIGLRYRTKVTPDGQLAGWALADWVGRELVAALGQDSITASAAGNYTHVLASGASQIPYRTVEQGWADEVERTTNCLTKSLKFEGEAGKPVKVTAQFISGGTPHQQSAALNPVRESGFPIMIPGGSSCVVAGGASSLQLTKWSAEIANDLDDAIQTNALNREDVTWRNVDFNIDGTLKYINNGVWNQVQYGGGTQVPTGLLTNGSFVFYSPTPSNTSLQLYAPFIEFSSVKVNRLDPDGKTMYLDFVAATRNVGTQSFQGTVVSPAAASYALPTT